MKLSITSIALVALLSLNFMSTAVADEITAITDLKRGTMVNVSGKVEKILDTDEFRLADDSGTLRVYVGPNWVPVPVGESVQVSGFIDDGLIGPLELYARSLTRADGTVVNFDHRYD